MIGEYYAKSIGGLSVRLWNIYGFEEPCLRSHVVCDFIYQALTTKKISMISDGTEERQFLHANDCANILFQIAQKYDNIDKEKSLHLSNFEWMKIINLAKLIADLIPGTEITHGSFCGHVNKIDPDPFAKQYFNMNTIDLKEGLEELIGQYKIWLNK